MKTNQSHSSVCGNDATAALRAELEFELKNKKQCAYQPYQCTQLTLDNYNYCIKHILNDKNAPFKQCAYTYQSNGKRCHLPAPKSDKKEYGYCHEHALKSTLTRNRQNSKYPPPHTAEVLLHSLSHYVKKPKNKGTDDGQHALDESELRCTPSLDPFTELDAPAVINEKCNEVLDLCSESESDVEPSTFSSVWRDYDDDSSDNDSVDSEHNDNLKHANVYTAEEVTRITKEKLMRLQALYIEQYRHLQHTLREKRRKYLYALKREKETCCNIYNQVRDNPKEQRMYKKLKCYNKYHKTFGNEAILNKRLHDLRLKMSDGVSNRGNPGYAKCCFTEGGVKCGERALPYAKHCRKHILEDPNQVLFKACGKVNADVECNTPVEAVFDDSRCRLHMDIPAIRPYHQPRKESESENDDPIDVHTHYQLHTTMTDSVKTELMDYNIPLELPKMESLPSLLFDEGSSSAPTNMEFNANFDNSTGLSCTADLQEESRGLSEDMEEAFEGFERKPSPQKLFMGIDEDSLPAANKDESNDQAKENIQKEIPVEVNEKIEEKCEESTDETRDELIEIKNENLEQSVESVSTKRENEPVDNLDEHQDEVGTAELKENPSEELQETKSNDNVATSTEVESENEVVKMDIDNSI